MNEDNTNKTAGAKLVKGATILAIAGVVSKILGAAFRIPLTNLIGAEGMAYYGVAYPVYSFFLILATAGLPVAISRMVSERIAIGDYRNAHRSYKVSLKVMVCIGVFSFIICFFFARNITEMMKIPDAKYSLMAIAPALLLAPIVSSFRGYFQGQQNMVPTAVSQVFEQIIRVAIGLTLSFFLFRYGAEYASAGATFGASAGLVAAIIVVGFLYKKSASKRKELIRNSVKRNESTKSLVKELLEIAIPITIGSTIMPIMMMIDSVVVLTRLQATGWTYEMAKIKYGLISGYCDPLVSLPGVFIDAITISLIPAVTAAFTLKHKDELNKNIQTGIKTMMVVAYPCAVGLIVLANPILTLLYPTKPEEVDMATGLLQILAVSVVMLSIMRTFSSALQGIGKMVLPVANLFVGALLKIALSYILVGIPVLNVNGAALGTCAAYALASVLNYAALRKYAKVELDMVGTFAKPLISAAIMGVATWAVYKAAYLIVGSNAIATFIAIIIAVAVYFVLVFLTKVLTREDASLIPKGYLIIEIADKLHLIRE